MPRDVSTHGIRIDRLINITLVFVTIFFVIMVVWMAIAYLRHDEKHKAQYTHGDARQWTTAKLGVVAIVFFGVDGNLFVNSTLDLHHSIWNFKGAMAHPEVVRIEMNAHQWAWEARYAGPDGKFGTKDDVTTLNDVRVPVGTPVVIQLGSVDVLHSLYIPNLRIKQDVVPGNIELAWFQAQEAGRFEIACAQHCGTNHYKMRAWLTVMSKEDFALWLKEAGADTARAYDPGDPVANWGWEWKDI